jgi:thymidylate kinase
LVDPLRYRLPAQSEKFARWLVSLAPRPDLYVLLDAPAEVVQRRKSELPLAESHRQRVAYLKMLEAIRDKLLVNANCPVDEVVRTICTAFRNLYPSSPLTTSQSSLVPDL